QQAKLAPDRDALETAALVGTQTGIPPTHDRRRTMWLPTLSALWRRRSEHAAACRKGSTRLTVERLEDRAVPATFTAANASELIRHINEANLTPESDTIALVARASFWLTDVYTAAHGATGLPTIAANETLTILGNGCTIERRQPVNNRPFRLFDVDV